MSILDVNLSDHIEIKTLPDNSEVQLRIARADVVPVKADPSRSQLALIFDVSDDPAVDDIRSWIGIPTDAFKAVDPKRYAKACTRLLKFAQAFGMDTNESLDTSKMVGLEGWAVLREEENEMTGDNQNSVKYFKDLK
jgi:hypothetical protein